MTVDAWSGGDQGAQNSGAKPLSGKGHVNVLRVLDGGSHRNVMIRGASTGVRSRPAFRFTVICGAAVFRKNRCVSTSQTGPAPRIRRRSAFVRRSCVAGSQDVFHSLVGAPNWDPAPWKCFEPDWGAAREHARSNHWLATSASCRIFRPIQATASCGPTSSTVYLTAANAMFIEEVRGRSARQRRGRGYREESPPHCRQGGRGPPFEDARSSTRPRSARSLATVGADTSGCAGSSAVPRPTGRLVSAGTGHVVSDAK